MPHPLHSSSPASAVLADQLWFSCSSCKGELKVPIALANSNGACPLCGEIIHIPACSEQRSSVTWQGRDSEAADADVGLLEDDPELEGNAPRCFHGDLKFQSGATQPLKSSSKGFFDNEVSPPLPESIARKESVPVKVPELPRKSLTDSPAAKSGIESFSKPLRKFNEPVAPAPPLVDLPPAKVSVPTAKVSLPAAPAKQEEVMEEAVVPFISSLEKDSSLFKPLRKYPPKQRQRHAKPEATPLPEAVAPPPVPHPLPAVVEMRQPVPVATSLPPPVSAPSTISLPESPALPAVPGPQVIDSLPSEPLVVPRAAPALPVISEAAPEPLISNIAPALSAIIDVGLEPPGSMHTVSAPPLETSPVPELPISETPTLPVESVPVDLPPLLEVEQRKDPLPPVFEESEPPAPKRAMVVKALVRSVALQRERELRSNSNRRKYAVPSPAPQTVAPPLSPAASPTSPATGPEPIFVSKVPVSVQEPMSPIRETVAATPPAPPMEAPQPKRLAIADLLEAEPEGHDVSPVLVGQPDQEEEVHQPVRIGGVVMPRYTLVPRGSQLRLWLQRAAMAMLCLLPLIAFSGLYMPYVRRVTAWVEEMKRSRISLEEIRQQTAENRNNPSAQGFKEDALAAMKQEWKKLTTPAKKEKAGNSASRPVVFRSSKTDFATANPETDWPQMLLRNHGVFHGHSSMEGGSSFLIEASDGSHWIATSAHLLGEAGGVEPPCPPGKLAMDLDHWRAHLPDKVDTFAEVLGGRQLMTVITSDWLAMRLSSNDAVLPVKPLHLRRTLLQPDETVYIVGLPYDDKSGAAQHVYKGQVTPTGPVNPSQFAILVQAGVDFSGFRGAPILDAEGEVVGVLTDRWSTILLATRSELLAQLIEGK